MQFASSETPKPPVEIAEPIPIEDRHSKNHIARVARLSAVYTAGSVAVRTIGFALLLLYTRFLSPTEFGRVALAESFAAVFSVFGWALQGGVQRTYFDYPANDPKRFHAFLGSTACALLALVGGVLVLGLGAGPLLLRVVSPGTSSEIYPYVILALTTVALNQFVEMEMNLLSAAQEVRRYTVLAIASALSSAALSLTFVTVLKWGGRGLLLGKMIAAFGLAAVVAAPWRRWIARGQWSIIRRLSAIGATLIPFHFVALGLATADRFILKGYRPMADVGIYSVAYTFGMVMNVIVTSVYQAYTPEYFRLAPDSSRRGALGQMSSALMIGLVGVSILGMAIVGPFTRVFLDRRYLEVGNIAPIVIASLALHGFFALLQLAFRHLNRFAAVVWLTGVPFLVNVLLNFALIPRYGIRGAAWATLIGYLAEAGLAIVAVQRAFPLPLRWPKIALATAMLGVALVIVVLPVPYPSIWMVGLLSILVLSVGPKLRTFVSIARSRKATRAA